MLLPIWAVYAILAITVAAAIYSYYTMRKMQKANQPKASQLDGTIADEGVSFSSIAGSPHLYGNIVWKGNESTEAIKSES
jgi:hypothetical protein